MLNLAGHRPALAPDSGLLQASEVPADAAADPKALAADLANERTLLAWLRTGLAAIRRLR